MTLNGIMALILCYFAEFGSFWGQLYTSKLSMTKMLFKESF